MNLPSGLLKNACDSFNIWSILLGKNMRWKKAKIRQEEEWVVPLCGILICLFFRSQSYLVLLFFNKWSVFLAKTKAFFKKHFNPYHITRQLKTRGMFFIKTVQSYLGGNAADFGDTLIHADKTNTKRYNCLSGARVSSLFSLPLRSASHIEAVWFAYLFCLSIYQFSVTQHYR